MARNAGDRGEHGPKEVGPSLGHVFIKTIVDRRPSERAQRPRESMRNYRLMVVVGFMFVGSAAGEWRGGWNPGL